jgi:thiol-disulfide isomerase/thioredoxin
VNTVTIAALALLFGAAGGYTPPGATTLEARFDSLEELSEAVAAATKEAALTETQVLDFSARALAISKSSKAAEDRVGALALSCGLRFRGVSPELDKLRGELWDVVIAKDADEGEALAPLVSRFLKDETRAAALGKKSKAPEVKAACAMLPLAELIARRSREPLSETDQKRLLEGLKSVQKQFGDVLDPRRKKPWGEYVDGVIFQIEHLSIGSMAAEIEAADTSGVSFKLSDYRGQVVLLDFWGNWCPPCRGTYPHERSLVARLKGEPFALVGVNSDEDLEQLLPVMNAEQITWRSFWNGPEGTTGPISTRWGISGWPTLFVIDAEGKIRHKFAGSPGDEKLDAAIDALVEEAKLASKK